MLFAEGRAADHFRHGVSGFAVGRFWAMVVGAGVGCVEGWCSPGAERFVRTRAMQASITRATTTAPSTAAPTTTARTTTNATTPATDRPAAADTTTATTTSDNNSDFRMGSNENVSMLYSDNRNHEQSFEVRFAFDDPEAMGSTGSSFRGCVRLGAVAVAATLHDPRPYHP